MSKRFTKNDFINWLVSKSPRTKVGFNKEGQTPVERYMRERNINPNVELPKWAKELKIKVTQRNTKSVSADAVLNLM